MPKANIATKANDTSEPSGCVVVVGVPFLGFASRFRLANPANVALFLKNKLEEFKVNSAEPLKVSLAALACLFWRIPLPVPLPITRLAPNLPAILGQSVDMEIFRHLGFAANGASLCHGFIMAQIGRLVQLTHYGVTTAIPLALGCTV